MVDYFSNENAPAEGNAANGAPQQTNGDQDLGMAEISVCSASEQIYDLPSNPCVVNVETSHSAHGLLRGSASP